MEEMPLYKLLERYSDGDTLPMHMPGHKRNMREFPHLASLGAHLDITEIDSFDDLNSPEGIFAESEAIAAGLWGSDDTVFSVNGSTCAVLAAVRCVTGCRTGRRIIVARNCHKSVYHAIELCACKAEYIAPDLTSVGFAASVTPESVRFALDSAPHAAAVIITSPTYEGVISDIASIAEICHERGVPLIVDEAHGAHLSLHGVFPDGAVRCGADIVIQSIHKTLPSLTQTALVHLNGNLVSRSELRRQMSIFQSSSPSYLLSASIDGAVRFLASDEGKLCLRRWRSDLWDARMRIASQGRIKLFCGGDNVFAYDESKLVILGDGFGIMKALRERNVELEMASVSYAIAMTGTGDTAETLGRFEDALDGIISEKMPDIKGKLHIPCSSLTVAEAVTHESEQIPLENAVGKISASYVYAYPPGVPILVPGETVDCDVTVGINALLKAGASVRGIQNGRLSVIKY